MTAQGSDAFIAATRCLNAWQDAVGIHSDAGSATVASLVPPGETATHFDTRHPRSAWTAAFLTIDSWRTLVPEFSSGEFSVIFLPAAAALVESDASDRNALLDDVGH